MRRFPTAAARTTVARPMPAVGMILVAFMLLPVLPILPIGCGEDPAVEAVPVRPVVVAANAPLEDFAKAIAGTAVTSVAVERPAPAGEDPTLWRPDEATIAATQRSELVLLQGEGVEPWGVSIPLPAARTRDTTRHARSRFPRDRVGTVHSHGGGPAHAHGANADHAWLDLGIARLQARAVRDALVEIRPDSEDALDERWRALDRALADLERRARAILEDAPPLLATHPTFDFLAHAHGLSIDVVEWPSGEGLDETVRAALLAKAAAADRPILLVEGELPAEDAATLEAIGVTAVRFDPLGAGDPEGRGFVERMGANLDRLATALAGTRASDDDAAAVQADGQGDG